MSKIGDALEYIKDKLHDYGQEDEHLTPLFDLKNYIPDLIGALGSLKHTIAFDSKDYSTHHRDFWMYGILVGWGDEIAYEKGRKFGLPDTEIARMQRYNKAIHYFQWAK